MNTKESTETVPRKFLRASVLGLISIAVCLVAVWVANTERFDHVRKVVAPVRDLKLPGFFTFSITVATKEGLKDIAVDRATFEKFQRLRQTGGQPLQDFRDELLKPDRQEYRLYVRDTDGYRALQRIFPIARLESPEWRERILTILAIAAVGVWFAAVVIEKRLLAMLLALLVFGVWSLLSVASLVNSFWLSAFIVLSLTLIGAGFILQNAKKHLTAPHKADGLVLATASLFLASGIFTIAGWFQPLPYAQALRNNGLLESFIDFRFLVTVTFAVSFIITGIISAIVGVWSNEDACQRIKKPVDVVAVLRIENQTLNQIIKHILAPLNFFVQLVVQAKGWIWEVIKYLVQMLARLFQKRVYLSALTLTRIVLGCWLIAFSCQRFGADIKNYLGEESLFWTSTVAIVYAALVFLDISVCVLGVHLLTYKKHSHFTKRDVPGKALPVVFAAWSVGLVLWMVQALTPGSFVPGFRQVGLFTVGLPVLLAVIMIVGLVCNRERVELRPASSR